MHKGLILLTFLLLLAGFFHTPFAQDHIYTHYDENDGLAGSTVYSIAQDRDGFLWFGTETGLSRFDGAHFTNFTTHDGLPANEILYVYPDSKGRVWTLPFRNAISYYYKGRIFNQQNDPMLRKLRLKNSLIGMLENKAGDILFNGPKDLHILHADSTISDVDMNGLEQDLWAGFIQIGLDSSGNFKIFGLKKFAWFLADVKHNKLEFTKEGIKARYSYSVATYIGPAMNMYTDSNYMLVTRPSGELNYKIIPPVGFMYLSHINDSLTILSCINQTYLLDSRNGKIVDSFMKDQTVNRVFEDNEGDLWFSTQGKGVYRLSSADIGNYTFKNKGNNLPVFCIRAVDSSLYVGTDHFNLWSVGLKNGKVNEVNLSGFNASGRLVDVVEKDKDHLLVGADFGLYTVDKTFHHAELSHIGNEGAIKSLHKLDDTSLLVSTSYLTIRLRLRDCEALDTVIRMRSTCSWEKDGLYYIGTINGLYTVDQHKKINFLGDMDPVFTQRIWSIAESPGGILWISTDGEGTVGYKGGKIIAHFDKEHGLISDLCRGLFVEKDTLWIGTDKGLNKVMMNPGGNKIITYTKADGLTSDIVNDVYVRGSKVFVGTAEGMNYFDEAKISRRSACFLRVTGLTISGKKWPIDTSGFAVAHQDNNIQLDYAGISFKSAGSVLYQYKLKGLEENWNTTRQTVLKYTSLPSGDYTLLLVAFNKFGVRSNTLSIKFTVEKLVWEKNWFRVLMVITLLGAFYWLFTNRVSRVRRKETEKTETVRKMAELEQMALRSQMNPHFIFNCLNSIQEYVLDRDVLGANEFITKFSNLIRQTLDLSSRSSISVQEELTYITTYLALEKKRFENKFIYEIRVAKDVNRQDIVLPPMILQPYVENAIRHGIGHRHDKDGKIVLSMELTDPYLVCVIEDNGVGRSKAASYKKNIINYQSKGMSLVDKRIAMYNKTASIPVIIDIEDLVSWEGTPQGTRIILRFPVR